MSKVGAGRTVIKRSDLQRVRNEPKAQRIVRLASYEHQITAGSSLEPQRSLELAVARGPSGYRLPTTLKVHSW